MIQRRNAFVGKTSAHKTPKEFDLRIVDALLRRVDWCLDGAKVTPA